MPLVVYCAGAWAPQPLPWRLTTALGGVVVGELPTRDARFCQVHAKISSAEQAAFQGQLPESSRKPCPRSLLPQLLPIYSPAGRDHRPSSPWTLPASNPVISELAGCDTPHARYQELLFSIFTLLLSSTEDYCHLPRNCRNSSSSCKRAPTEASLLSQEALPYPPA